MEIERSTSKLHEMTHNPTIVFVSGHVTVSFHVVSVRILSFPETKLKRQTAVQKKKKLTWLSRSK